MREGILTRSKMHLITKRFSLKEFFLEVLLRNILTNFLQGKFVLFAL